MSKAADTKDIPLTLACGDYEIVRSLIDGSVKPEGIELTVLTRMDAATRHRMFLRNGEFDMAELSSSSYLMACDRGLPFRAIPVFLHRRFRHGFVFINTGKGIVRPTDLVGRRMGLQSFHVSATLWLRGILEHEYGVPHKSIEWHAGPDEDVDFTPPPDLKLVRLARSDSLEALLLDGTLDAVMHSDLIAPFLDKDPRVGRLFPRYKAEEIAFYRKTGIFPIMHVMGLRAEIVERHPWIAGSMYRAFEQAKANAMKRMANPRLVPLAWYSEAWEEQQEILGKDPWEYGVGKRNLKNLETLVGYSCEQGLIRRAIPPEELFLSVDQGREHIR